MYVCYSLFSPFICHCRYLRRFRNEPAQRREDRPAPSLKEFWWGPKRVSAPSTSSKASTSSSDKTSTINSSVRATENSGSDRDFEISSDATPRSHGSSVQVSIYI